MTLRAKVMLTQDLSGETLDALRSYLRQFLDRKHSIEHFDGRVSIYLHDPADVRLLREHFPSLIMNVQRLY
jgi:hypothetical protein